MSIEIKICADDDPMGELLRNIRVYGTLENPLFLAKDVESALGLKNLNYSNDESFDPTFHKCYVEVPTHRGVRTMVALTECGLYKAIFRSHVAAAERFQHYVYCVLKRLRVTGSVTREQALADREELHFAKQDLAVASQQVRLLTQQIAELEFVPKEPIKIEKRHKAVYVVGPEDGGDYTITERRPKPGASYQEVHIPHDFNIKNFSKIDCRDTEMYLVVDQITDLCAS